MLRAPKRNATRSGTVRSEDSLQAEAKQRSTFIQAAENGDTKAVRELLPSGANAETKSKPSSKPPPQAADESHTETVRALRCKRSPRGY